MNLTDTITAGDTLDFVTTAPSHPASEGWQLVYRLVPRGTGTPLTVTSVPDGDAHRLQAGASVTAAWAAGAYSWVAYAMRSGERYTLAQGAVQVLPDPATVTTLDNRSTARRALDAVEAYLADPNNLGAASYEIAGRSLSRYPLEQLWAHRDRLRVEVAREESAARAAAGLPDRRRIYVRFGA